MRRIQISFEGTGETAIARLEDEDAPATCNALWSALELPLVANGIHAAWAGREIMLDVPEENRVFDPTALPKENLTLYPIPGDICWGYFPERLERGSPDPLWDIAIVYGRETRFDVSFGPCPMTLWAIVEEGLDELARASERVRTEGIKRIRLQRV